MAGFWFTATACARCCIGDRADDSLPPSSRDFGWLVDHCAAPCKRRVSVAWFCYPSRSSVDWTDFAGARLVDHVLSDSGARGRGACDRDRITRPRRILDRRTHVRPPRNPHPRNASTIDGDHSGSGLAALLLYFAAASLKVARSLR